MSEFKTAQLRVKRKAIIAEGAGGTIFWATPSRARLLIDAGACELMNANVPARPAIGPSETKPQEPAEKKFSAAAPAGPSTDSASSSQPGAVAQLFASVVDLVSPKHKSARQKKQAAESSQSTTATE
ncbi:MAG: hypothetical protein WC710_15050 [Gallionella sp.]|jgi:hypothetical protein